MEEKYYEILKGVTYYETKIYILCHVWHVNRSIPLKPKTVKIIIASTHTQQQQNKNKQ